MSKAENYFEEINKDLNDLSPSLAATVPSNPAAWFGLQQLLEQLPSPPISADKLVAAALAANAFYEQNHALLKAIGEEHKCKKHVHDALDYVYNNPVVSGELTFEQLQAAVDAIVTQPHPLSDSNEKSMVIPNLAIAKDSLKALKKSGFRPRPEQMRHYTRAWFDVTEHLNSKMEKKGEQRRHIASLIEIRDELGAVTNQLGVLAEASVDIDIPEF